MGFETRGKDTDTKGKKDTIKYKTQIKIWIEIKKNPQYILSLKKGEQGIFSNLFPEKA